MFERFHFPDAIAAVDQWLTSASSAYAGHITSAHGASQANWKLDFANLGYPIKHVTISLRPEFPAAPCELYVDDSHCLQLPHVEEDGKVCLDNECQPEDYASPIAAVARALERFSRELLEKSVDVLWKEREFHAERLSYWARFCYLNQEGRSRKPTPHTTFVNAGDVKDWESGHIAAYIRTTSKRQRIGLQVVTLEADEPENLARRHAWSAGTFVRGRAIFVRLPENQHWTPSAWPTSFQGLLDLVNQATAGTLSFESWLQSAAGGRSSKDKTASGEARVTIGMHPLLVVLCLGTEFYGYQITQPPISRAQPNVAPLMIQRVDPAWILSRDHESTAFESRREKRVLVLGCGSLGSPVAEILARSGVGHMDIVDKESMEGPNVARHALGMTSIRQSKARALAGRLTKEIPGGVVRGFENTVQRWTLDNCHARRYDLVVDCTADSGVRTFLAQNRGTLFGVSPIVHAWVEPFCGATHVVASTVQTPWPVSDPVQPAVCAAIYPDDIDVKLPACSGGFHPYGSADIMQAAGFCTERVLAIVDKPLEESTVWSYVKSKAFFDRLGLAVETHAIVPASGGPHDGSSITRKLTDVLTEK